MDQCNNCTVRGDLIKCTATPCSQHENWFAKEQAAEIAKLRGLLDKVRRVYTRDDDLQDELLPRIDAALDGSAPVSVWERVVDEATLREPT